MPFLFYSHSLLPIHLSFQKVLRYWIYIELYTHIELTFIYKPKYTTLLNGTTLTRWQSNNGTVYQTKDQSAKIWLSSKNYSIEQKLLIQNKHRTSLLENNIGREWQSFLNNRYSERECLGMSTESDNLSIPKN